MDNSLWWNVQRLGSCFHSVLLARYSSWLSFLPVFQGHCLVLSLEQEDLAKRQCLPNLLIPAEHIQGLSGHPRDEPAGCPLYHTLRCHQPLLGNVDGNL